jgi:hypothetical protein
MPLWGMSIYHVMPIQLEKNIEQTLNHAFNHYTCQNDTLSKFMIFHHMDLVWGCDMNKCYQNQYLICMPMHTL